MSPQNPSYCLSKCTKPLYEVIELNKMCLRKFDKLWQQILCVFILLLHPGQVTPDVRCLDMYSGLVEDYHCDIATKPSEWPQPCNDFPCAPK